jgi:ABC-type glutathione transport system ATPase component
VALDPVRTIGWQFGRHLARLGGGSCSAPLAWCGRSRSRPIHLAALDRYAHQRLSGSGVPARVLIAMAFARQSTLLIADEPTTALDVTTQKARSSAVLRRITRLLAQNQRYVCDARDLQLARFRSATGDGSVCPRR